MPKQKKRKATQQNGRKRKRRQTGVDVVVGRNKAVTVRGRGSYFADVAPYLSPIGAGIGGLFGGPAGAVTGGTIGSALAKLTGRGDYYVSKNTLRLADGQPNANLDSSSSVTRVRHSEYLGDIVEPANNLGSYTNRNYYINPGLITTFPWLSQIATNYEQWEPYGMFFEFRSNATPYTGSTTGIGLGTVTMTTDYDSTDPNFTSKQAMNNTQYTNSADPTKTQFHFIECDPNLTTIKTPYVRINSVPTGKDQRLYDLGNFQIATIGIPNNASPQNLGELWVHYDIGLKKSSLLGGYVGADVIMWKWRLDITSVAAGAELGTAGTAVLNAGSAINAPTLSSRAITFPSGIVGNYQIQYMVRGASTVLTNAMTLAIGSNVDFNNIYRSGTTASIGPAAGETAVYQWVNYSIKFIAASLSGNTVTFTGGTLPGTISSADLIIMQVNQNITS